MDSPDDCELSSDVPVPRHGLRHGNETYAILGACFAVYREKGCGFLEAVYQECLEIELTARGVPFVAQQPLQIAYRGKVLRQAYAPDFICYGKVLVELKAVRALAPEHRAQTVNYLRATGLEVALLVNFGHYPQCEQERLVTGIGRYQSENVAEFDDGTTE
jgi:GxxExxY protein